MRSICAAGAMTVVAAAVLVLAQAENPQVGFWKMNIPQSKFSSGTGFKSATSRIEHVGDRVKHTIDSVYADGTARQYEYTVMYDGKDVAVVGNSPYGDTVALTRLDANTTRTIYKNRGAVTVIQTSVVSADGKIRTVTTKGTNPAGQAVDNVSVYDRQ